TLHCFVKAGCDQLAFNYWTAASEACCYGGDRLLTNFCYPRERQRKCPCVLALDLRDSVLHWRVVPGLLVGFDPPHFEGKGGVSDGSFALDHCSRQIRWMSALAPRVSALRTDAKCQKPP